MSQAGMSATPIVPPNEKYGGPGEYNGSGDRHRGSVGEETAFDEAQGDVFKGQQRVDTHYASQLQPSKLRGRALNMMVTVVAGTGVSVALVAVGPVETDPPVHAVRIRPRSVSYTTTAGDPNLTPYSMSALLTLPAFEDTFPQTRGGFGGNKEATLQSLLVAIYELGCMAGALSNLYVGDRLGRRHTITL
jgi:hypothetical protein